MNWNRRAVCLCALACVLVVGCASTRTVSWGERRISGPYTHANLAVFVIRGQDRLSGKKFLTMDEALKQKKLVVYETGDVGELRVENKSKDEYVYIQSGEIVKGGEQDRTLRHDTIIPPMSGRLPLRSYCVDEARWSPRGGEPADIFAEGESVPTRNLKLMVRHTGDQSKVWNEIAKSKKKMAVSAIINADLDDEDVQDIFGSDGDGNNDDDSDPSKSMQLVMEHEKLKALLGASVEAMNDAVAEHGDAVGFAYAVNGKLSGADVYGSRELFRKLWPKLAKATAAEAFAEWKKGRAHRPPSLERVKSRLLDLHRGTFKKEAIGKAYEALTRESRTGYYFRLRRNAPAAPSVHDAIFCK